MNSELIKIGTLGTGRMAGTLGKLWAAKGHRVFFGSREPQKARQFAASIGHDAQGGTQAEALAFGDVILLTVPGASAREVVRSLGPWEGKILVDLTNRLQPVPGGAGVVASQAEEIAKLAVGAKVVKAFNMIHFQILENPQFGAESASAFFCGDDGEAKAVVAQLSRDMGFDPVDTGPLENARLLEPLGLLWIRLAGLGHGRETAFKLLKR